MATKTTGIKLKFRKDESELRMKGQIIELQSTCKMMRQGAWRRI